MVTSPLQLKRHFLLNVQINYGIQEIPDEGLQQDEEYPQAHVYDVSAEPDFQQDEDNPENWKVELRVRFRPKSGKGSLGYRGEVAFMGIFSIPYSENDEDKRHRIVAANAPAVLYGSARELVLNLTLRGLGTPLILPTVNFTDIKLVQNSAEVGQTDA